MKLPQITYRGVAPLKGKNIAQEAAMAKLPYDIAGTVAGAAHEVTDFYQVLKEQRKVSEVGNKMIDTSESLTAATQDEWMSLDNPLLDKGDLRQKALMQLSEDPLSHGYAEGVIPTSYIASDLAATYAKEMKKTVGDIKSKREQDFYQDYVGEAVNKNMATFSQNIVAAEIATGRNQRTALSNKLANDGKIDDALDVIEKSRQEQYYDDSQVKSQQDYVYAKAREYTEDGFATYSDNYQAAIDSDNPEQARLARKNFIDMLNDAQRHGDKVITQKEAKEWTRQFDWEGDQTLMEKQIMDAYSKGGLVSANQIIRGARDQNKPKAATQKEWQDFRLNRLSAIANSLNSADQAAANDVAKLVSDMQDMVELNALRANNNSLYGNKAAQNASNEEFGVTFSALNNNPDVSNEDILNFVVGYVGRDKFIPKNLNIELTRSVQSGDPEKIQRASIIASALQNHPETKSAIGEIADDQSLMFLNEVNMITEVDPEARKQAIAAVHRNFYGQERKDNLQFYSSELEPTNLRKNFDSAIENKFDASWYQLFTEDPAKNGKVFGDYQRYVRSAVANGATPEGAYAYAEGKLNKTWGVETVNGSRELMKYPLSMEGTFVPSQVEKYKKDNFPDIPSNEIVFKSDALTGLQENKTWGVYRLADPEDPTSAIQMTRGNKLLRYKPDFKKSTEYKEAKAYNELDELSAVKGQEIVKETRNIAEQQFQKQLQANKLRGGYYNTIVADANVMEPILEKAKEQFKEMDSFYDVKTVGSRSGPKRQQVLNVERFDAAVKQVENAINQARRAAYEAEGMGDKLPPHLMKSEEKPESKAKTRLEQRASNSNNE